MAKTTPETAETMADESPRNGDERATAVVTHVLGLLTLFLGPLVMYFLFRKKASPWLRAHLDEAVNYHILVVLAVIAFTILAVVFTSFELPVVALLFLILLVVVAAANIVFSLLAIVWAGRGKSFHFPLDIQMIK